VPRLSHRKAKAFLHKGLNELERSESTKVGKTISHHHAKSFPTWATAIAPLDLTASNSALTMKYRVPGAELAAIHRRPAIIRVHPNISS
jgi:hypothetical protein